MEGKADKMEVEETSPEVPPMEEEAKEAKAEPAPPTASAEPATKKPRTGNRAEAEIVSSGAAIADRESAMLMASPSDLLAIFRQLARSPAEAQREDDENKRALLEALKLRHEYACHPEGWVARRKRSSRDTISRWGVTDSGALRSRVGANYQVSELPDCVGREAYTAPMEWLCPLFVAEQCPEDVKESFMGEIEPLYKAYVLRRREERTSYRDFGTFREFALQQLHASGYDGAKAARAIETAMAQPAAFEAEYPYEIWTSAQSRVYKSAAEKYYKLFALIHSRYIPAKPIKALISFYYRSKHVDDACRRGPILLVGQNNSATIKMLESDQSMADESVVVPDFEINKYNWLQIKCECRRWLRILERFRYLYQVCPDCESVICLCPACSTPIILPKEGKASSDPAVAPLACPNCCHVL